MMERFFEFLGNHWILSGLWVILLAALLVHQSRKSGKTVGIHQATMLINREDGVVLDIRDKKAFDKGHIIDAVNIPLSRFDERMTELDKHKDKPVIVVCQMGHQSADAVKKLEAAGFSRVYRLSGGMAEWQGQSLPVIS